MVYLIMGLPGTGKTYLAKALAERWELPHSNTDGIRAEHGLMGDYDPETKERVYELLLQWMMDHARQGEDVVVDATFVKKELRDRFIRPLEREGLPYILIRMVADRSVIEERVQKDRPDSEAGIEVHDKLKEAMDPVERDHIVLDSGKEELDDMLERIAEGTEKEAR